MINWARGAPRATAQKTVPEHVIDGHVYIALIGSRPKSAPQILGSFRYEVRQDVKDHGS